MPNNLTAKQKKEVNRQVKEELKNSKKLMEKRIEEKLHKKFLIKTKNLSKSAAKNSLKTTTYIGIKFRHHTATAIIAAFGFLIAISWRDIIVKIANDLTSTSFSQSHPYITEFLIAGIITLFAIIGIAIVSNWAQNPKSN